MNVVVMADEPNHPRHLSTLDISEDNMLCNRPSRDFERPAMLCLDSSPSDLGRSRAPQKSAARAGRDKRRPSIHVP